MIGLLLEYLAMNDCAANAHGGRMEHDMSEPRKLALVIGANGVIGGNLIEHLLTLDAWDIVGLSRRGGVSTDRLRYIAVDLLDREATRQTLAGLSEVTHIFYAAYQDRPSWAELVPPNRSTAPDFRVAEPAPAGR